MKKAIALILVLGLLAAGVLYLRNVEHADQENMRDLYSVGEPLQREREALLQELDNLEADYALQMRDIATVELLFRELDKKIFTDVYPLMRDQGIVGVLGISHEEYPGLLAKLTLEQFNRLITDGWSTCLLYDRRPSEFESWYNSLERSLEHDKIPMPTAIFFADESYDSSMDLALARSGIRIVIQSTEDGHSAIVNPVGGSRLWFTGAMPWNYTGINRDTEILSRTSGANLVFTLSFKNLWDAFDKATFTQTLETWQSMLPEDDILQEFIEPTPTPSAGPTGEIPEDPLTAPRLRVVTAENALVIHETAEEKNAELEAKLEARQAELEEQIAALDEEIRGYYEQWSQQGDQIRDYYEQWSQRRETNKDSE